MEKFKVTLSQLRDRKACVDGYNMLVCHLTGVEFGIKQASRRSYLPTEYNHEVQILTILKSNGLDDALWATQCIKEAKKDRDLRMYALWCIREFGGLLKPEQGVLLNLAESLANEFHIETLNRLKLEWVCITVVARTLDAPYVRQHGLTRNVKLPGLWPIE